MENITHSRQPNMFSKKNCNGATTTKSIYDDVFGGPPKFGAPTLSPRVEDYSEIFGGFHSSRASSIPVLDLPSVDDEAEVLFDVCSSGLDYAEVFGGLNGHDFAVSYEDLMMMDQSNGHDDSSDEAWTPEEAENLSEESDHSTKEQFLSNGEPWKSIDGCTEFKISYNKASKNCDEYLSNEIRHATQLHDVSGYTFVVDKSSSLLMADHEYCYLQAGDDDHLNIDYTGEMLSGKHLRKVMSHPANGSNDGQLFRDDVTPQRDFVRNASFPNETFLTISDVSLRTRPSHLPPPSRPPPEFGGKMVDSGKTTPNCRSVASEDSAGDSSPPYFDVDVDASSSAAVSAAAVKEAMEKAQAKLKNAKESMEKKLEGFQTRSKSISKNDRREKEEKVSKIDNGSGSKKHERGRGTIKGEENGVAYSILEEKQKVKMTARLISDSLEGRNHLNVANIYVEENQGSGSLSSQERDRIDVAGEWKEATQFFELVTNKSKKAIDQGNNENILVHDLNFYDSGKKEKKVTGVGLQQHQENGEIAKAVRGDHELEEHEKKAEPSIKAFYLDQSFEKLEEANKQKRSDRKVKTTQEAPREKGDDKAFSMDWQPVETEKRLTSDYGLQRNLDSIEVQQTERRQNMKQNEKGSQLKEDNRSTSNIKRFTHEKEDRERIQRKAFELKENEKNFNAAFEPSVNEIRLKRATQQEEKEKMIKAIHEREEIEKMQREPSGREQKEMRLREAVQLEKGERRLKRASEKEENERRLKENRDMEERLGGRKEFAEQEEHEMRQKEIREREQIEKIQREVLEREAYEKRLKEAEEKKENERRLKENRDIEERQRRRREVDEQEENERGQKEISEREQIEKRQREVLEREAYEKRLKEAEEKKENERRLKENRDMEENERRLKENRDMEEKQKSQRVVAEQEENERRWKEIREREQIEKRQREVLEREAYEKRLKEAEEKKESEKRLKQTLEKEERQRRQREAVDEQEEKAKREREQNEKRLKEVLEKEGSQRRQREAIEQEEALGKEENERRWKAAVEKKQRELHATEDVKQQRKTYEMGASEMRFKGAFEREEIAVRIEDARETKVGKRLEEVCGKVELEAGLEGDHESEEIGDMSKEKCWWEEMEMKNKVAGEIGNQTGLNKMAEDHIELNHLCRLKNNGIHVTTQLAVNHEEDSRKLETTKEIACEESSKMLSELVSGEKEATSGLVRGKLEHEKRQFQMEDATAAEEKSNEKISGKLRADSDSGNQGNGFAYDRNESGKNIEEAQVPSNQENNKVNFMSAGAVKEPDETGIKMKGAQPDRLDVNGSTQRAAQQVNAGQGTEREVKNSFDTLPSEDRESERMKRERELERERLRKIEEEMERERERMKDRMAVDRAALETCERAYAEARERAERAAVERATAEVRQRALNEARERLEKACAEVREKSFPDKASVEARIRAERAAVERATAEARERAFEKAMAERAAFESRERIERSVSDKFSASSRNSGIKPSSSSSEPQDVQSQGSGTFNGSRYQYSSIYSERYEGVEGESPQRCKARLERQRRTAERAAKALAEKNMRDLLAQREQAERNRLAETLDADVKRWSNGKEGNLRALLSTLQYILGPESGWHPIPLTEVITAAAVKRAYKKATLSVHPDKLQQRGAGIQQKYICEKVFDLLKEAWNKFNSEER